MLKHLPSYSDAGNIHHLLSSFDLLLLDSSKVNMEVKVM